jgi:glycosyltransferase involved in cell wall biosynthesis
MRSRKIHIFAYWHDPRWKQFVGATVKIIDLAVNLSDKNNKVILFLPKYNFKSLSQTIKIIEIPFINFPIIRLVSYNINLLFFLLLFAKFERPDVVYVRRMMSIVPLIYGLKSKAKIFYEINDDPYHYKNWQQKNKLKKLRSMISAKIDEINLYFCTICFVITDSVRRRLINYNPNLSGKKCIVLPSGSNTILLKPMNMQKCRKYLNINSEQKIVGFVGSLLNHQGIDTLINSAPIILDQISNVSFIIVGEGPMKKAWESKVSMMNLKDKFHFVGQVDYENVAKWIAAFDVCVAPYLKTAGYRSPVKIFDYMACAKPVIASYIAGTTDIFENSDAIKLIAPDNSAILADEIIKVIKNENLADAMGRKGFSIVTAKFDRKKLSKKILSEIEAVKK